MLFKLSNLNSNLALTLGYLNPALNNSVLYSNLYVCGLKVMPYKNIVISRTYRLKFGI